MSVWTTETSARNRPLLIAHRGASEQRVENTLESFHLACQQGADVLEVDVQLTADGVPVAFHDDDLSVRYGCKEAIAAFSYADLNLQFPDIPLLSHVLEIWDFFYIDVKSNEIDELVRIFDFCRSRCDLSGLITAIDQEEASSELFKMFPGLNQVVATETLDDSFLLDDSAHANWVRLKEAWLCEDVVSDWAKRSSTIMVTCGGYGSLSVGQCTHEGLRKIESTKPGGIVVNNIEMANDICSRGETGR